DPATALTTVREPTAAGAWPGSLPQELIPPPALLGSEGPLPGRSSCGTQARAVKPAPKPIDHRLAAVVATIIRLEQMENCAGCLHATAPRGGRPARGPESPHQADRCWVRVEFAVEEWGAMAIEHQLRFSDEQSR